MPKKYKNDELEEKDETGTRDVFSGDLDDEGLFDDDDDVGFDPYEE